MNRLEGIGLAWALGMAGSTALAWLLHLLAVGPMVTLPLVCSGLALSLCGMLVWQSREGAPAIRLAPISLCCAALIGLILLRVAQVAIADRLQDGDAISIWLFKAEMFAAGGPTPTYFHAQLTVWSHPDYPLNVPIALAAASNAGGLALAALVSPASFAALLLLVAGGIARLYGAIPAALATLMLATLMEPCRLATMAVADMPLALYAGAAGLYLLLWWRLGQRADAWRMALLAGGCIWTKKEGLVIAAIYLAAFAVAESRRPRATRTWAPLLGVLAIPLPWLAFMAIVHPAATDFLPFTPSVLVTHVDRVPTILHYAGEQAVMWQNWGLFWPVLLGVLVLWRRPSPLHGVLALQLGAVLVPYIFSDWYPWTDHVVYSLDRLVAHLAPLAVVALVDGIFLLSPVARLAGPTWRIPVALDHPQS
jgi:hypothetical protein